MADIVDLGNDRAEEILNEQLAKRRPEGPKPFGFCHYCSEPIGQGERWCNVDCRDDWELMEKRRKQSQPAGDE